VITTVCNADMFNESGSFTIRFVLDNGADSGDVNVNSLNPNECTLAWWNFPRGLPSGEHYIYVYLSPGLNVGYIGFKVED
jgi:hypothetical protein